LRNHSTSNTNILELIEGVGSNYHPLFLYCDFSFSYFGECGSIRFDEIVTCKWNNNKKVYFDSCIYNIALHSCFSGDSCIYQFGCGGIEQYTNSEHVIIAPNPSNGNFTIELSSSAKQTIQVYDVNGKLVLSQIINGKTTIDASSLNEGVYNIIIISNEGVVNKRLVIVH
jgi:hypothetical protein